MAMKAVLGTVLTN